jgi:hypothetical protein
MSAALVFAGRRSTGKSVGPSSTLALIRRAADFQRSIVCVRADADSSHHARRSVRTALISGLVLEVTSNEDGAAT